MQYNVHMLLFSQLTLNMATYVLYVTDDINSTYFFFIKKKSTNILLILADVSYNKAAFRIMFELLQTI
jgi:hypothetical protein